MLAGRINTNWLIIDGRGGDVWKNSESGANMTPLHWDEDSRKEHRRGSDPGRRSDEVCPVHAKLELS